MSFQLIIALPLLHCASLLPSTANKFLPHRTPAAPPSACATRPQIPPSRCKNVYADGASSSSASPLFSSLNISVSNVVANLAGSDITAPNALQRAAFPPIAAGRDTILHAWTGSGKTLAFLVPLLEHLDGSSREPQALILSPSRELAFQIHRVAEAALAGSGLGAAAVVGGANPNRQLEKIKKTRPQLIIGTPGRVAELAFEWKKLKLQRVRHVVIDEVDEALRPPHLDHTLELLHSMQDGRPLQLIFASATADTPAVRRVAAQLLTNDPLLLTLLPPDAAAAASATEEGGDEGAVAADVVLDGEREAAVDAAATSDSDGAYAVDDEASTMIPSALGAQLPSSITHGVWVIERNKGLKAVHALHHTTNPPPRCLVFVNSPHRAKVVCQKLWEAYGIAAAPLYGEQEREERVDVMRRLLDGRVRIAVTTEMGARGLDIPGLTHVINLELPTDPQHYVHRAGRCGRAGKDGTVLSLAPPGKAFVVDKLTKSLGVPLHEMHIKGGDIHVTPRQYGSRRVASSGVKAKVRKARGTRAAGDGGGSGGAGGGGKKKGAPKVKRGYPKQQPAAVERGRPRE